MEDRFDAPESDWLVDPLPACVDLEALGSVKLLRYLDSWRFWMLIAYLAIVAVVVTLIVLGVKIVNTQADQAAEEKAAQTAQVLQCVSSARNSPDIQSIVGAIGSLANSSIISTRQALVAYPNGELAEVRRASLKRLTIARNAARKFGRQIKSRTPSLASCKRLAGRLNVSLPKGTDD